MQVLVRSGAHCFPANFLKVTYKSSEKKRKWYERPMRREYYMKNRKHIYNK
jgi:hypothetical protein